MQLAVHVLAYDVNAYINPMLRNVAPHVEKIYLAYPKRPWNYIPSSRETRTNPTELEDINFGDFKHKVEVIQGDWEKEEDTRNSCFDRAKAEGFDWLIIQDADEFYTEESWAQIRGQLKNNSDCELYKTPWFNFWKSSEFVIADPGGSIKDVNAGFAVRCKESLKFARSRTTNARQIKILDCPCYHYGWVKSDEEMWQKVTQWGHAHQFNGPRWYEVKWLNWTYNTVNLSPIWNTWCRAIRFPLHQPDFAHEYTYAVDPQKQLRLQGWLRDSLYDLRFETRHALSRVKRMLAAK
jgi:hypothetical protein